MDENQGYTAFAGYHHIITASLGEAALGVKGYLDSGGNERVLVFDDQTGDQIDLDLRGSTEDILTRLQDHPALARIATKSTRTGPGRPKLGVVSREVSLLPRHWDWLSRQRGGASAALRRIVDEARKNGRKAEPARHALDAAHKFMWIMAGDFPGFEEASRTLYARDFNRLSGWMKEWPKDVREHVGRMAAKAARLEQQTQENKP
ncbi:MAG: DUF2239 family protein [Vicinamibacteria bacterium]|nr:DUF2239 family protein [Vicinamibacteria bacterium]